MKMIAKAIFMLVLALAFSAAAETDSQIWVEAESFEDWGGWVNDTQFMDQMHSPYLLAHGLGKSVADAKTKFVADGGEYDVWVRTKNWTAFWWKGEGAGKFNLIVNGKAFSKTLGCQGNGEWLWVNAGRAYLKKGENTIALRDLDGFDGRVDVIVFSKEKLSADILNVSPRPSQREKKNAQVKYDTVVVGGGVAGICAAISSARLGLKTALVHDRPVLGGNNSSEVRVHLGAYINLPPYPRLGDVVAEIGPRAGGNAQDASVYEDNRKMAVVKATKGLDLFLNMHVNGVVTNAEGRIVSVVSQDTRRGGLLNIEGKYFVDCTGDGTVGYLAGADYRMGRESKSETREFSAPEVADMLTMGSSVQWRACVTDKETLFPDEEWMLKSINEANYSHGLVGDWWWETGFGRNQISDGEYIRDYGLLVAFSNWSFVKNRSPKKRDFKNIELNWVAYNAGRRESRRLLGDFILDQNHLRNRDIQKDGTCATTWTIDLHSPRSASETKFEGEPYQSNASNEVVWPYPVPYRCLYSRNVPNLFMAGRDISVTHIALGTTRLMRTHGMMGEVVGMAASVCKKHDCDPRDVYTKYFDELKTLMEEGIGDGERHPRQDYNCQASLDENIRKKYLSNARPYLVGTERHQGWRPKERWCGFNLLGMFCETRMAEGDKRIFGYFPEDRFEWMHEWGFNFARVPLDYRFFVDKSDWMKTIESQLVKLDEAVKYGKKYGIHVQINFHRGPGYCCNAPKEPMSLFHDKEPLVAFTNLWAVLARRYRGIPNEELSFDLLNEPAPINGMTPSNYAVVARAALSAIRAVDPNRFVMSDGWRWGKQPVMELHPFPPSTGESIHCYEPQALTHHKVHNPDEKGPCPPWPPAGWKSGVDWLEKNVVRLWRSAIDDGTFIHAGELGCHQKNVQHATYLAWLDDTLEMCDRHGWGWAVWNIDGTFGVLDTPRTDCKFEDFRGHKLDRKALDILIKHLPKNKANKK